MKIGDTVWIPHLKTYARINELNWDGKRIKTVSVYNQKTGVSEVVSVLHMIVETVTLVEKLISQIISFFRKSPKS